MIALFLVLCSCLTGAEEHAALRCDPPVIDLGQVRAGQVFQKQVRVSNTGTTPTTVREIKSSCGCLRAHLEPSTLAPGQTGLLSFQINTLSASPGVQGWRVRLLSPEGILGECLLRAEVVQELVLSPAALTLYGDKASSHTVTLKDRRSHPLRLLAATTTTPRLTARVTSPTTVQIDVQQGFPEGRNEVEVILTTDDALYPQLHFPVKVVIRPRQRFVALPREIELSASSSAPLLSRLVTVRDQQGQPLAVDRIETSHPFLKAEVVSVAQASAMVRVRLELPAGATSPVTGWVSLFFRGTAEPLTLPVRCP